MKWFNTLRFKADADVNDLSGFTQALATATGRELSDEEKAQIESTPDRSVAGGLTSESSRGEDGRFQSQEEPADEEPVADPPAEEVAPPAEGEQAPTPDFEQGYLKALGEQSEKLGAAQARIDALEAAQAKAGEDEDDEPEEYFPTPDAIEALEELLDERGGQAMMSQIASSSPEQIPAAMAVWKASGDPFAYIYEEQVQARVAQLSGSAKPVAPELPPELADLAQERKMQATFQRLASGLGDRGPKLAPFVDAALAEAGPLTREAITSAFASDDSERHEKAFNELVTLAEAKAASAGSTTRAAEQQIKAEVKSAARVITGSQGNVSPGQSGDGDTPATTEEFDALPEAERKAIATKLVAASFEKTNTTSVADGLTSGGRR